MENWHIYFFRKIFKYKRVLSINLITIITLILIPSIFLKIKRFYSDVLVNNSDPRANYPVYKNKKFAKTLLNEYPKITQEYKSFIAWRRKIFKSKYTNVGGKYNTRKSLGENIENSTWFFGGSTMWGFGAPDSGTIPSIYSLKTNEKVMNFAENGWNSRQSLNMLLSIIGDENKPKSIIFYDGE